MIDSHVNLHHHLYKDDLNDIVSRANDNGVDGMLTICDRLDNIDRIKQIAHEYKNIWYSVGAHPHEAKDHLDKSPIDYIKLAECPKVIGIGETGLDFHYNFSTPEAQISVFEHQIIAAQEVQLPLIVHTRNADELMGELLLKAMKQKEFPLLLHCYTSSNDLMKKCIDIGAFVSISGIATFKNADDVRANIYDIPLNRLIIETDCPYLAPIPKRGQRNEPAFIDFVAEFIAQYLKIEKSKLIAQTDSNFFALFKKAQREV